MKVIEDLSKLKVLEGQLDVKDLEELKAKRKKEEEKEKEETSTKKGKMQNEENQIFLQKKWLTNEESVKKILTDFFFEEERDIVKVIKKNIHLNNNEDKYSESDFILKNLEDESEIKLFKKHFNSIDEYSHYLYNSMAELMVYNNPDFIIGLLYSDTVLGTVIKRAMRKSIQDLKGSDVNKSYIVNELAHIFEKAKSFNCDLDELDENLKIKKQATMEAEKWIVGNSYTMLDIEKDDFSGRDWVLQGAGSKYGRYFISFDTAETRGLTITEFYGGGVVD